MKIRKFFDTGAEGGGTGGGESVTVGERFSLGDIYNQATKPEGDEAATAEATKPEAAASAEPAATTPAATETKPAETKPAEDTKPTETKPGEAKPVDLKEVLKGKERREVLEAMGIDSVFIDMLDYHQSTGDLKGYLDIKTRDWDKVPADEIMRDNLKAEYGDLSEEDFQAIYDDEISRKYAIGDEYTEDEKRLGKIRMERDAKKVREQKKTEQAGFKIPEPKPTDEAQRQKELAESAKADYDAYVQTVTGNDNIKKLLAENKVVIGEGENAYNFEVKGQDLVDAILDTNKLFANCIVKDKEGKVTGYDFTEAAQLAAFALNRKDYLKAYYDFAQSKVNQELLDEHVNPDTKEQKASPNREESQAQAFVNRGVHTNLGAILGR
jgi:hypothetical protein